MDKRRGIVIGALLAAIFLIAVSATYIYIAPEAGRVAGEEGIGVVVTILPNHTSTSGFREKCRWRQGASHGNGTAGSKPTHL